MSIDVSKEIPDLWPSDVAVTDIQSPLTILRHQAGQLRARTRNLLEAEIVMNTPRLSATKPSEVKIEFYVVATALDRYRYLLFTVTHHLELVYPAKVVAECVRDPYGEYPDAEGQEQLMALIRQVLSSPQTRSVIHSLIARSNDAKAVSGSERLEVTEMPSLIETSGTDKTGDKARKSRR